MDEKTDFGIVGMGVMGRSLARNFAGKGVRLSLFNRRVEGIEERIAAQAVTTYSELEAALPFEDLRAFCQSLRRPRKVLVMIPAGTAVDTMISEMAQILEAGDVILDGGNSHFEETSRREMRLRELGIHFLGVGVSGGEEGALHGPALMPGGAREAWEAARDFLQLVAARNSKGEPCCEWMGPAGAGHFVKTIHNGIEYAEMQLLAELYTILRLGLGRTPDQIAGLLDSWQELDVDSYLLQITAKILRRRDGDGWLIDKILDQAGNKGTGKWTTQIIADLGVAATMIPAALWARYLSSIKATRETASRVLDWQVQQVRGIENDQLLAAYRLARFVNHHQGFEVIREAFQTFDWEFDLSRIARVWTNGCIIRSRLIEEIAFESDRGQDLESPMLLQSRYAEKVHSSRGALANLVAKCVEAGLAVPCFSEAINFLNGFAAANGSANIIQAQRDCFGAHTYRRVDDGLVHHTEW